MSCSAELRMKKNIITSGPDVCDKCVILIYDVRRSRAENIYRTDENLSPKLLISLSHRLKHR